MRIRPGWARHRRPREKAAAQGGSGAEPDELTAELTASYWRAHDQRLAQTSFGAIARQLPRLVGQAIRLGWEANRRDTVANIALNLVAGVLTGFALLATTGVLEVELAAFDDAEFYDAMQRARDRGTFAASAVVTNVLDCVTGVAGIVSAALVVAVLQPVLLVLLLLAELPEGWAAVRAARIGYITNFALADSRRRRRILTDLMAERDTAAEMRSFTLRHFMLARVGPARRVRAGCPDEGGRPSGPDPGHGPGGRRGSPPRGSTRPWGFCSRSARCRWPWRGPLCWPSGPRRLP